MPEGERHIQRESQRELLMRIEAVLKRYVDLVEQSMRLDLEERSAKLRDIDALEEELGILYPEWTEGLFALMNAYIMDPIHVRQIDHSEDAQFAMHIQELDTAQLKSLIERQELEDFFPYATDAVIAGRMTADDVSDMLQERQDVTKDQADMIELLYTYFTTAVATITEQEQEQTLM